MKKVKYLIADTTAFINAVNLNNFAENIYTVPDVIEEVRNKRQIRRLCVLPYDLQVREPRAESVKYCVEFAKKTGDYASLSGIDLKVIALTYEFEVDNLGAEHLRAAPVMPVVISSKEKTLDFEDNSRLVGWYNPSDNLEKELSDSDENSHSFNESPEEFNKVDAVKAEIEENLEWQEESNNLKEDISDEEQIINQSIKNLCLGKLSMAYDDVLTTKPVFSTYSDSIDVESEYQDEISDNDNDNWITPENIKSRTSIESEIEDAKVPLVACITSDFALQNVLKQINLQMLALDGKVIKNLRTYILRCYACFKTTSIMTKVFCPNCGNKTLKRVSVSLDENGKQMIHINTKRPLSTKFKNQSLPRFGGGKHSRNPILFEDQPIPRQMPSRVAKTKTNALDEDYTAGFSPFVMRDIDSKSAILRSKGNLKEWARNNTFEEDRRRKRYNRIYK